MDTPEMVYADIMLELQASCREKRAANYEVKSTTPLGIYEQALTPRSSCESSTRSRSPF
jgi:hypothetical protein